MSAATGKSQTPPDPMGLLTHATKQITTGAADYSGSTDFVSGYFRRIYVNSGGTIAAQRDGDSSATTYTVFAGQYLDGLFTLIGGTTNYPTTTAGLVLNLEQ